jgi:3-methylfumaryl-CoA hydratase
VTTQTLVDVAASWRPEPITVRERIDVLPSISFAGLLDTPPPVAADGDPLPPLWHWLHLLDRPATADIGPDGHRLHGPFLPPIPDRRRMFAGGRLVQHAPFRVGSLVTRRSSVVRTEVKKGSTGELLFVTVRDEYADTDTLLAEEDRHLMYRSGDPAAAPEQRPGTGAPAPVDSPWQLPFTPDPVSLFRFSALTYNAHRIHYDQHYTRDVEGFPDLVVHGPLLALLALELPRRFAPDRQVASFSFRAKRPAYACHRILVHGGPSAAEPEGRADLTVATSDSPAAMTATAEFAP